MAPTRTQYITLLTRYLRPQRARVSVLGVLLISSIVLQVVNPQILRSFIDATANDTEWSHLRTLAIVFIAVALLQQVLSIAATYHSEVIGWTAMNELRADLTRHALRLDLSFHKSRTPGELIERIDGDVTALANFFSQFIIRILGSILLLFGILLVLSTVDWRVPLGLGLFAVVTLGGMLRLRTLAVPYWEKDRQSAAELFGFIEERLGGTVDIRSSGAQPYVMRKLYEHLRVRLLTGSRARVMSTWSWAFPMVAFAFGTGLAFGLAAYLYRTQGVSLGTAFLVYYYTQLLWFPLQQISHQLDDFQKASAGIIRVYELLGFRSRLEDGPGAELPTGALSVEFESVTFAYEEEDAVIHDVSFRVRPGEVLGLLGRTGSGKTTLTRLLLRLYDPTEGRVLLGGVDVRQARLHEVRRHIGMVTQDVQLFRATVRDNLTLFDPAISDDRILTALSELGLEEWVRGLPNGLNTMLESGGGGLSAGEAQLLAFTRVFLKDPGLVILDEASSRVDPATERLIERAVTRLFSGRTGIIIAHRLGTVQRADSILILEAGTVVEHGDRDSLCADPGSRFSELLRTGVEEVLV